MKKYHFTYYTDSSKLYSKGVTIEASSIYEALEKFRWDFPNIEPFAIIDQSIRVAKY